MLLHQAAFSGKDAGLAPVKAARYRIDLTEFCFGITFRLLGDQFFQTEES
jgi:hypothetical protein